MLLLPFKLTKLFPFEAKHHTIMKALGIFHHRSAAVTGGVRLPPLDPLVHQNINRTETKSNTFSRAFKYWN